VEEPRRVILCVDDEAVILLSMRQELRRRFTPPYTIEIALGADAADAAIGRLESEGASVEAVVCDWFMPGRKGDRFLAELGERRPGIGTILMTGQSDEAAIQKVKEEAGVFACLQKPWRPEALAAALEACLADRGAIGAGKP